MPRIVKTLPSDRAAYSFGDLIYWHLFVFGTRPGGAPSARAGRKWEPSAICELLDITDRTLRNWIADKHLPDSTVDLERELFGDNPVWDDQRLELAEALRRTRGRKGRKAGRGFWRSAPTERPFLLLDLSARKEPENRSGDDRKSSEIPRPVLNLPVIVSHRTRTGEESGSGFERASDETRARSPDDDEWNPPHRRTPSLIVTGVAVLLALYVWSYRPGDLNPPPKGQEHAAPAARPPARETARPQATLPDSRRSEPGRRGNDPAASRPDEPVRPETPRAEAPRREAANPEPPIPAAPRPQASPPAARGPLPPPPVPRVPPEVVAVEKPAPAPVTQPKPPATKDEERAEQERRTLQATIEAMKAAHDREKREQEDEARRLDREGPAEAAARARQQRERSARTAAGMGYRLLEYTSVTGQSLGHVQTETVDACALSCLADGCDAFAWFRAERPAGARTCFRFKAPVTFFDHPSYTAGKKTGDVRPTGQIAPREGIVLTAGGESLAQLAPAVAEPPADDLTHCPTGPVKVTGFTLSCDQTLGGGTTLGSNRLSWTVANINECAAKCRPIKACVGFAYNAAEQGGHSCILFGPVPEARESLGWITGTR